MRPRAVRTFLGLAAVLLAAPAARAQTFDFEAASGTTPLSLTDGGVTATFGNPGAPFFEVLNYGVGTFAGLSGNVLGSVTNFGPTLGIDFSTPLSAISLDYALTQTLLGGSQLTLEAFLGGTPVGSTTDAAGVGPSFPEGTATFAGATFDRVVLSSDAGDFAIDDVRLSVAPAAVPEPATVALLGAGLGALALGARRRRATR